MSRLGGDTEIQSNRPQGLCRWFWHVDLRDKDELGLDTPGIPADAQFDKVFMVGRPLIRIRPRPDSSSLTMFLTWTLLSQTSVRNLL